MHTFILGRQTKSRFSFCHVFLGWSNPGTSKLSTSIIILLTCNRLKLWFYRGDGNNVHSRSSLKNIGLTKKLMSNLHAHKKSFKRWINSWYQISCLYRPISRFIYYAIRWITSSLTNPFHLPNEERTSYRSVSFKTNLTWLGWDLIFASVRKVWNSSAYQNISMLVNKERDLTKRIRICTLLY